MKQLLETFHFEFLHVFNFFCILDKEASSYIAYMVNSFLVSLDIPGMINILDEMTKILHRKYQIQYICIDSIMIHQGQ